MNKITIEEKNKKFLDMVKQVILDNFRYLNEQEVSLHLIKESENKVVQARLKDVVIIWEKCGSFYIDCCDENNEQHCRIKQDFMQCFLDLRNGIDRVYKYVF